MVIALRITDLEVEYKAPHAYRAGLRVGQCPGRFDTGGRVRLTNSNINNNNVRSSTNVSEHVTISYHVG